MRTRRLILALGSACWATLAAGATPAYPDKPIRMLVAFAPGGNTDILARAVAFFVPAKTPKSVIAKLNSEIVRVLKMKEVNDFLLGTGVEVTPSAPGELSRFVKSEEAKYRKIIQVAGVKLD